VESDVPPAALHVLLKSGVPAFHFEPAEFAPLSQAHPDLELVFHTSRRELRKALPEAECVDTWSFDAAWYAEAPKLRAVFTPAAGKDWVAEDPAGRVPTRYGTFHGAMIAESMLGLMLHFNRFIPDMLEMESRREWNTGYQSPGRLLRSQRAVIVGYGSIGRECARVLAALGATVTGCRRSGPHGRDAETGATVIPPGELPEALASADHVVLVLPGGEETRGFMSRALLSNLKRGAHLYNFGRGNSIGGDDLLWALDQGLLAGAGLDVTEPEPLPEDSPLWTRKEVFVMPHSSCVFDEYRALHVAELSRWLSESP
jgi:D-2-hydroxyacid dehydrogenase (NADP+)